MVFLSDGQCSVQDKVVVDLCRSAIRHGLGLLFAFADGSLTGWLESRFLFMLFFLARTGIRRLLVLIIGGSLPLMPMA